MTTLDPYVNFNGNCEDAFNFYRSVFGGEFNHISRFEEMPDMEGKSLPESEKNRIMHISLPISKGHVLMGSDTSETHSPPHNPGNNMSISINADSKEEADRLFNALSEEGQIIMPIDHTFWGSYFGMSIDKFGIQWMVNFNTK